VTACLFEKEANVRFVSVLPKGMYGSGFYYIDEGETLEEGDLVCVGFGKENIKTMGRVVDVVDCDENVAPYPVDKAKKVLYKATTKQYDDENRFGEDIKENDNLVYVELERVGTMLECGAYAQAFLWAKEHNDTFDYRIAKELANVYKICADAGIYEAALELGIMYYDGFWIDKDYKKAAHYYAIAAKEGSIRAICNLGYCYYYGRHQDVDYHKAYEYFNKGIVLGNDANCLYKLGDMYRYGYYVEQNLLYAFTLYKRAVEALTDADMAIVANIDMRLSECYQQGIGVEVDLLLAYSYCNKALVGFYAKADRDIMCRDLIEKLKTRRVEIEKLLEASYAC